MTFLRRKRNLASGSCAELIMSLVIILLALSTANGHEGTGTEWKWKTFGERKMMHRIDEKPSHISAKEKNEQDAVKNFFTGPQQNSDGVNAKNKGAKNVDSSDLQSSKNENMLAKHEHTVDDSNKAWLEAADEVANLMGQDYKGKGRPKRKPPINNHEPTN